MWEEEEEEEEEEMGGRDRLRKKRRRYAKAASRDAEQISNKQFFMFTLFFHPVMIIILHSPCWRRSHVETRGYQLVTRCWSRLPLARGPPRRAADSRLETRDSGVGGRGVKLFTSSRHQVSADGEDVHREWSGLALSLHAGRVAVLAL
ncbi:hypothetical protein O3P69_010951 [Scylla paramamosain]|uniref:Uncharacterized protein n=1 Tax=Scylla paramamosain TaxID=85552 RepID=A0AAW0SFA5_SCYPA